VICYKQAYALQINQIFGVDAGAGTWSYHAVKSDGTEQNIDEYVTESHSTEYSGAVILNGLAIYENPSIGYSNYPDKKVEFTYTPVNGSCLQGKPYKITVILTPDIVR
jgi:hypothetical protein